MKKIGLIGGMSWESTLLYYKLINEKTKELLGGFHSAKCIIESVDFAEIAKCQAKNDWKSLDQMMIDKAKILEAAGAEIILICANTMHLCVGAVETEIAIPILHIAEVTATNIKAKQLDKIALLGTKFTMEKDFFSNILEDNGISVLLPNANDRNKIHDIIYTELVDGKINDDSRNEYIRIINDLKKQGAQGVILGCTEIPLLIKKDHVDLPLFNTTQIHAEEAVRLAIGQS